MSPETTPSPAPGPASDPVAAKKHLRRALRAARAEATAGREDAREREDLVAAAAPLIARAGQRARDLTAAEGEAVVVSAFWSTSSEPDVLAVVSAIRTAVEAEGAHLRVLFPATSGGALLDWIDGDERRGAAASQGKGFGDEPDGERCGHDALSRADLILAPALAVDASGTRLGHGGGYYDRALPFRRDGVPVVAVLNRGELLAAGALVREPHDVLADAVLTPDGLTSCADA